jgi:hypothetical protein
LGDSPPTVIFKPDGDYILVQFDSYGSVIGDELLARSDVVEFLESKVALCAAWLQKIDTRFSGQVQTILKQINPAYPDIVRLLPNEHR